MATARKPKHYNLFLLLKEIPDEAAARDWSFARGLVPKKAWCPIHKKEANLTPGSFFGSFRCRGSIKGKPYDHQKSGAANTWFERLHTDIRQRLILTYCFSAGFSFKQCINEASIKAETVSSETVSDVMSYCREVCMANLDAIYNEQGQIGGEGIIVEIDECKIGKRKYNRGRMVEGHWILGMMERNGNKGYRLEICPENCRSEEALMPLIQKHVAPGTEIHTDLWKGYSNLENYGYTHLTVNHSEHFVDPVTGAYTQNVESSWRSLRKRLARGGVKDNLDLHLCEFLWRRHHRLQGTDLFKAIVMGIKQLYPGAPQKPEDECSGTDSDDQ